MKAHCSRQRNQAMTLFEAVIVILVIGFLVLMLIPALRPARIGNNYPNCHSNLRQTWLACNIWAGDNNGKYPMEISITNGGAMEYADSGNSAAIFQVMSNELSTPKILICRSDNQHIATTNFSKDFNGKNISYFVGVDTAKDSPQTILFGDANLEYRGNLIKSGLHLISTNLMYTWTTNRHGHAGNIVLADGSVHSIKNHDFTNQIIESKIVLRRLVIP